MECTVKWLGSDNGMSFVAETGSKHMVMMDGAPEAGGRDMAPRPLEMILAGTGGCTAFDVVLILKRGRHQVSGCEVRLEAARAETDPKVFTKVHFHYVVSGKALKPEAVARDKKLSIAHIGTLVKSRNPETLWKVLKSLSEINSDFKNNLEITLVGKVDYYVMERLKHYQLDSFIRKIDYLPHNEVIKEQQKSKVAFAPCQ